MSLRRILAISKRPVDSCANRPLLHAAGLNLLTTDNLDIAYEVADGNIIRGMIVCMHSWSDDERKEILTALKSSKVPVMRCPGCVGYDETTGKPGTLDVLLPLTGFIERAS